MTTELMNTTALRLPAPLCPPQRSLAESLLLIQPSLHLFKVQLVCIRKYPSNVSFNSSNMSLIHWGVSWL